jgi:hypothetical protein
MLEQVILKYSEPQSSKKEKKLTEFVYSWLDYRDKKADSNQTTA